MVKGIKTGRSFYFLILIYALYSAIIKQEAWR